MVKTLLMEAPSCALQHTKCMLQRVKLVLQHITHVLQLTVHMSRYISNMPQDSRPHAVTDVHVDSWHRGDDSAGECTIDPPPAQVDRAQPGVACESQNQGQGCPGLHQVHPECCQGAQE